MKYIVAERAWDEDIGIGFALGAFQLMRAHAELYHPRHCMKAQCFRWNSATCADDFCKGKVPNEACSCGIYGAKSLDKLVNVYKSSIYDHTILGKVALWGKIIEHERGYRAEFAYPLGFYEQPKQDLKNLANAWGVEILPSPQLFLTFPGSEFFYEQIL